MAGAINLVKQNIVSLSQLFDSRYSHKRDVCKILCVKSAFITDLIDGNRTRLFTRLYLACSMTIWLTG